MIKIRATFDNDGFVNGFYPSDIWPHGYPSDAVEISHDNYVELLSYQGLRRWDGEKVIEYTPPPAPPHIPDEISRRQFFQQLAVMDIIAKEEALSALTNGLVPTPLQVIIDQLQTEDDKFNAQMLVIGASTFNRKHPLAEIVRQAMQWTVEQKDNFWREASKL